MPLCCRALHRSTFLFNHYEVLGVSRDASKKEIKAAFVSLSKKYHPDVNPELKDGQKSFVKVNEAYSVLGNSTTRQIYDRELLTAEAYRAQFMARKYNTYAGSAPSTGGFSFGDVTHERYQGFDYDFSEIDWEQYKKATQRPKHSKVILSLIAMMVVATGVQSFRIHWAHKQFQERSDEESRRNFNIYAQVRENAIKTSVHEQLDTLSKRHSDTLRKLSSGSTSTGRGS